MYNIFETTCQDKSGNWTNPSIDWTNLGGVYVLAHKYVNDGGWRTDDNKYLGDVRDAAVNRGKRNGLWIAPDGIKVSYAKAMLDLAGKVGVDSDKKPGNSIHSLLPAIVIGAWSVTTANQLEGDFFNYFNSIMLGKFNNVVLGLNKSSLETLLNCGSTAILKTLALSSVRIWYFRYGLTAQAMNDELKTMLAAKGVSKTVWLAGVSAGVTQAEWSGETPPAPDPEPEENDDLILASHFQAIADVYKKRGTI